MEAFLAYCILAALAGLAVILCAYERRRKYQGLKLPRRKPR